MTSDDHHADPTPAPKDPLAEAEVDAGTDAPTQSPTDAGAAAPAPVQPDQGADAAAQTGASTDAASNAPTDAGADAPATAQADAPTETSTGTPAAAPAPPRPARAGGSTTRVVVALALGLALGRFACGPSGASGASSGGSPASDASPASEAQAVVSVWTCSMHPQIRLPTPGLCPICSMDLIPLSADGDDGLPPSALAMSENARALAGIVTQPIARRAVNREVRMVGKVSFDETRLAYITAWVPSRLDRLFVDYTGITVRKGDHMADVYSPELIATQQELIQAVKTQAMLRDTTNPDSRARQDRAVQSARDRLRLWGLGAQQIDEVVERGVPLEHITINSPATGVVIQKAALQGETVQTGTRLFTIADLTRLWVQLDAYESDLAWLHYGQHVEFVTEAWPGRVFEGRISFIDPVLDDRTRTVKVRLNVDNSDGQLKPEMFVSATVLAPITAAGVLVDPEFADRWMCPMHPEVVADAPGACSVCGMDLVPTAELGFRSVDAAELPLVIPSTAPLITGKRAVVYVQHPDTQRPTFEGREVALGPRVGDWYVVKQGLTEGELVVVHGGFKLDSELQIRARPSMMNPAGDRPATPQQHDAHEGGGARAPHPHDAPAAFRGQLGALVAPYLEIQRALGADDPGAVGAPARRLSDALKGVDTSLLGGDGHAAWMPLAAALSASAQQLASADDIAPMRTAFLGLSDGLIAALDGFGFADGAEPVAVFHCPMAFDDGAHWLQSGSETINPYFGASMLRCGERVRELQGAGIPDPKGAGELDLPGAHDPDLPGAPDPDPQGER